MNKSGVIETATGDLLRYGFCDFENDGSFDPATETQRTDIPQIAVVRKAGAQGNFTRWDGSNYIQVPQPPAV